MGQCEKSDGEHAELFGKAGGVVAARLECWVLDGDEQGGFAGQRARRSFRRVQDPSTRPRTDGEWPAARSAKAARASSMVAIRLSTIW